MQKNPSRDRLRFCFVILLLLSSLTLLSARALVEKRTQKVELLLDENSNFTIALNQSLDPITFHPHTASDADSLLILNALYEGLYALDPATATPQLALAERVEKSDDNLTWTFYLRNALTFSNGDPITAQSFIDSWISLLGLSQAGNNSSLASLFDVVLGAKEFRLKASSIKRLGLKALDERTIEITLISPAPHLPSVLALSAFAPLHPTQRGNKERYQGNHIITSGPFVIEQESSDKIVLQKNPYYWDLENVGSDYITILRSLNEQERATAFQAGEIEWSTAFVALPALKNPRDLRLAPQYATGFYYFSAAEGPYAKPEVRKALTALIPWDEVGQASGQLFPCSRLIPFTQQMEEEHEELNKSQVLTLLGEAGYANSSDLPPLAMAIHRGSQLEQVSHQIADIWSRELGLTVILDTVPLSLYTYNPKESPYDFAFATWIGDFMDPFAFLHLWLSDSSYNLGRLHDSTFDTYVHQAMAEEEEDEISRYYNLAEERLLAERVVIPMYHGFSTNFVATERVEGWYSNLLDIHPLKYLRTLSPIEL